MNNKNEEVFYYKDKPYRIFCKSKIKISGTWEEVIIYECLYENKDGKYWVRFDDEFYFLFKNL